VMGGFYYITAGADEGNAEKGKKLVMYAVIGILVIISSYTIVATVINLGQASQGGWGDFFGGFF